jgi:DNA-binding transcriptional MerR regulator
MDNQHRQIKGYRELTPEDIALMNRIKAKAEEVGALVREVQDYLAQQHRSMSTEEKLRVIQAEAGRWASMGNTDLQRGFMALIRAVAQPTTF